VLLECRALVDSRLLYSYYKAPQQLTITPYGAYKGCTGVHGARRASELEKEQGSIRKGELTTSPL
jgi:hypothetical protein